MRHLIKSSALYDPRAQCVAIPPPSTMSRVAQQSQRAMISHSGAYSVRQSHSMGPAVRYPAHTYAAHPYIRHQGLPRPPPTYQEHTRVQVNQEQFNQQQGIIKLQQQLQIETNHPSLKVAIVPNASTNNQTILSAVNNDIESRIEQIKKKNDQKQYNIASTDRARGNGKRRGTNCKDGITRNAAARRNRALSNNVERIISNVANNESSDRANIVTNHGYSYTGVNPQYSSSESTSTNSSAVDNNMDMYSNSRANMPYSNSENAAANVSPSNNGTNSSPISGVNGYYASSCPTSNPVHHNVPTTTYQTNVNSGINIRQNPYARVQSNISSQPCGQPCSSSQISRPNCEMRENIDNSASDNINRPQSFQQVVTAQQPAVRQCLPTNVVGDQVPSSYSPQNIVPGNILSNAIPIPPLDSQSESPPSGSTNDSIIGHQVRSEGNQVETSSYGFLNPPEWIDDLDDAILIYIAFNIIEPFDIHSKKFYQTTNELYKKQGKNMPFSDWSPISTSLPQIDLTLTPDRPFIKAKPLSEMLEQRPAVGSKNAVDNVSNQTARTTSHVTDASALLDFSDDLANDNTLTLYSNKGVRNVKSSTLAGKEIICVDPNKDEVNVCTSNQNKITLCPSNQNVVNLCLSNQNKDTSTNSQKCQEDSPELPSEPANEPVTTNSSSQNNLTTNAFKSDDVICLDLDDETSNECNELKKCPSNNQRNGCTSDESRHVQVVSEEPIAVNEINKTSSPQAIVKPKASKQKRKNEGSDNSKGKLKKKESFNKSKHSQKELDKESNTKQNDKIILVIKKKKTKNKSHDLDTTSDIPKNLPFVTEISNTNKSDISITKSDSVSSKKVVFNNDISHVDKKDLGSYVIIHNAAIVKSNILDSNDKKHKNNQIPDTKLASSLVAKPNEPSKINEKITEISNINHLDISITNINSVTPKEVVSNNDLSQDGTKNLGSYVIIHKAAIAKSNTFDSNVKKHKNNQILDSKLAKSNESYKRKEKILTSSNSVKVIKQPYLDKPSSKALVEIDMFKEQDSYKRSLSYYFKKYKIKKCSIAIERLTIETLQQFNINADEILKFFPELTLSLTSSTVENKKTLLEANDEFSSTTIKKINEDDAVVEQSQMGECKKPSEGKKEENQVKEEIHASPSCDDLIRILGGDEEDDFNKKANRCLNSEKNLVNNNFLDKIVVTPLDKNEKLRTSASENAKIDKHLNKIESPKITETSSIYSRNKTYDAARIISKRRSSDKKRKHSSKTADFEHDEVIDSNASSNTHSKLSEASKRRVSSEENGSFNSVKKERRQSLDKNISSDKGSNSLKNEKKLSASNNIGFAVDKGFSTPKNERRQSSEKKIVFGGNIKHHYINNERRQSLEKMSSSGSNQRQSIEKNTSVNGKSYNSSNKKRRQSSEKKISFDSDKIPSSCKNKKRQNLENNINSLNDNSSNFSKNEIKQNIKQKKSESTKLFTFTSSDKPIKHNTDKNNRSPSEIVKSGTPNVKNSLLNLPKTLKRTRSEAELCSRSEDNMKSSPRSPNKHPMKKRRKSENDKDLSLIVHIDKKAMKDDLATFSNNINLPIFSSEKAESDSIIDNPSAHSDKLVNHFHRSELPNKETHLSLSGQEKYNNNRPHGSTSNNTYPTKTILDNKSPPRSTNLNEEIDGVSSTNLRVNNHQLNETALNGNEDDIMNNIFSYIDSCVNQEVSDPRLKAPTYCGFDTKQLHSNFNFMNSSDVTESYLATQRFMRENKSYTIPDFQNCTCYGCSKQFESSKEWRSHVCVKN